MFKAFALETDREVRWSTMTPAEKITLHVYPIACMVLASNYLGTAQDRLDQSPSLRVADNVFDIRIWGLGFLLVSLGMIYCLITHRGYWVPLSGMIGLMWLWALVFAVAAFVDVASPTSWVWPATVASLGWASVRSLTTAPRGSREEPHDVA